MTNEEFAQWIEDVNSNNGRSHYQDLLALARELLPDLPVYVYDSETGERYQVDNADAKDATQQALARMLSSPELRQRTPRTVWPWAVLLVRSEVSHLTRGQARAETALGHAGVLTSEGSAPSGSGNGWFAGPFGWRLISPPLPKAKPPAPDQAFGEHSLQSAGPCSTCRADTMVRLSTGRDYSPAHGRTYHNHLATSCRNGHTAYSGVGHVDGLGVSTYAGAGVPRKRKLWVVVPTIRNGLRPPRTRAESL